MTTKNGFQIRIVQQKIHNVKRPFFLIAMPLKENNTHFFRPALGNPIIRKNNLFWIIKVFWYRTRKWTSAFVLACLKILYKYLVYSENLCLSKDPEYPQLGILHPHFARLV